jgi:mxaL protein
VSARYLKKFFSKLRQLSVQPPLVDLVVVCALLAFTFAQPSAPLLRPAYNALVVIDITQSMNTTDYSIRGKPVSRLHFAKQALRDALRDLECGSRVGIGIFTEYRSFLLLAPVEVCASYHELADALRGINGQMAWAGGSEVMKGVNSGLRLAAAFDPAPGLIFITDGHEAPPLHPQYPPRIEDTRVGGAIVGAGATELSPIPKVDPAGKPLGFWNPDEVLQTDTYSRGRAGSGESLVDEKGNRIIPQPPTGTEHLSSLKESHLQAIAAKAGMSYRRLDDSANLSSAIKSVSHPAAVDSDLRWALATAALTLLVALHLPLKRPRRT